MENGPEVIFEEFIVTCHTDGCENAEIPIQVSVDISGMLVYCGPCAVKIEDIVPVEQVDKV